MRRIKTISVVVLFGVISIVNAQYYGLRFNGHDAALDERTGLELFPGKAIKIDSELELSFDFKFEPNQQAYFGYIFRCIFGDINIDLISSPYDGNYCIFHVVVDDEMSNISFTHSLPDLINKWNKFAFKFNVEAQEISIQFADSLMSDKIETDGDLSELKVFFGAHRYERFNSTDVPGMNLREVELFSERKRAYYWPMRQNSGNVVVEKIKNRNALVTNPSWIIDAHSSWKLSWEKSFPGYINYAYNSERNEIAFLVRDSLMTYSFSSPEASYITTDIGVSQPGSQCNLLYDGEGKLVLYSLDQSFKHTIEENSKVVQVMSGVRKATDYWHHNRLINPENGVLYTFGGYGQLKYSNEVYRFNDKKGKWDTIEYRGYFGPRYLSGLSYNPRDGKAYILGGYGSRTGNQEIAPRYCYDLLSYSFKENTFETLHEFEDVSGEFCFSNNMVIDTNNNWIYGLRYSKLDARSNVQAVAISLEDYSLHEVGDTFTYNFLDVRSRIDLHYNKTDNRLVAICSYFDENETRVRVKEIASPPLNLGEIGVDIPGKENQSGMIMIILLVVSLLMVIVFFFFQRRSLKKKENTPIRDTEVTAVEEAPVPEIGKSTASYLSKEVQPGSIIVFGGFQVIDKEGNDITNSFSSLLKELFLYIMLPSIRFDKGVSSGALNEVFWFDKTDKAARNNRAVNIAKLRSLLEKVGECRISKDTGYWKFEFQPSTMFVDYYEYQQILKSDMENEKNMLALHSIIHRGPALSNIQADWLDDFKSGLSNEIIDSILAFIDSNSTRKDSDFNIQLANCVFYFDTVNERAMSMKCKLLVSLGKHSLAKNAYEKFTKEYHTLYGEEYKLSFNQILKEDIS